MKKFLLFSIMLIPIFLLGCGKEEVNNEVKDEQRYNEANVAEENTQKESDFVMSDCMKGCEMIRNKETSRGQMLSDCKSLCEAGKAIEENDADSCENSEGIMKDSCYVSIATETNNPKLCEKVTEGMIRNGCYSSIAEESKDVSFCDNIKDSLFKNACIEGVSSK